MIVPPSAEIKLNKKVQSDQVQARKPEKADESLLALY